MTSRQFIDSALVAVGQYLSNPSVFDENTQLTVNPVTSFIGLINGSDYLAGIARTQENGEIAAAADRPDTEEAADYQEQQDRDYYPVRSFVKQTPDGRIVADIDAIRAAASKYGD
ncbi:MAG: hypothetical protein Q4C34_02785 [Bacteroidales bacterium]|nr:hypothetical protein [Bacteroidales bacterium]